MDKSALEQLISRLNWWMGISTAAVAVGILGEYLFEAIAERKRRRKSEIVLSILFGALVLVGVVGEYIFGSKLSNAAGELQRQADLDIAGFNAKAEAARKSASEADERAARASERAGKAEENLAGANERAAKAEEHSAEANKTAESFRRDIAVANEHAVVAEQRAAEANLALAKFRAPRTIAPAEQVQLSKALEAFAGTPFDLSVGSDTESLELMQTMRSILSSAKWTQIAFSGVIGLSGSNPLVGNAIASGVIVEIDASRRLEWGNAASVLVMLLQHEGISVEGHVVDKGSVTPNAIHIAVGTKPRN